MLVYFFAKYMRLLYKYGKTACSAQPNQLDSDPELCLDFLLLFFSFSFLDFLCSLSFLCFLCFLSFLSFFFSLEFGDREREREWLLLLCLCFALLSLSLCGFWLSNTTDFLSLGSDSESESEESEEVLLTYSSLADMAFKWFRH